MTNENYTAFLPGYAKCVGRIGALAATLGVGVAIATGQGIAVAHAEDGDGDTTNTSDVDTASAGVSNDPTTPKQPRSTEESNNSAPTQNMGPTSIPRMKFANSGGALTSDGGQRHDTPPWHAALDSRHTVDHRTADIAPVESSSPAADPTPSETAKNQRHPAQLQRLQSRTQITNLDAPEPSRRVSLPAIDLSVGRHRMAGTDYSVAPPNTITSATTTSPTITTPTVTRPATVLNVTTNLLSAALSPFVHPGPAAPAQPPVLLAVLGWVRREIEHTFFNRVPDVQNQTVTVHPGKPGTFQFVATDDNKLTYSVPARGQAGGPTKGTVTIDQSTGSFTYTADPTAQDGQSDQFVVTVSDAADGFHVHGLLGFLRQADGHTDTATVTVNFENQAPVASSPTYTVTVGDTKHIDLFQLAPDPEGDPLTRGEVVIVSSVGTLTNSPGASLTGDVDRGSVLYGFNLTDSDSQIDVTGVTPGTDTITYTVSDGTKQSTGVITIIVVAANPDDYTTDEDTALTVSAADGVLKNDDMIA